VLGAWAACPFFSSEKSCLITSKKLLNGVPGYTEQKTKREKRKKGGGGKGREGEKERKNKQMNEGALTRERKTQRDEVRWNGRARTGG
jgi:ribosomal protein S17E